MARTGCSVKFGRFKWNRAGYAAMMNGGAVQGMLRAKAAAVKAAADADLSEGGYRYEGHEVRESPGALANGFSVRTKTDQARYSQAKRKTLKKALGAAKEGS